MNFLMTGKWQKRREVLSSCVFNEDQSVEEGEKFNMIIESFLRNPNRHMF